MNTDLYNQYCNNISPNDFVLAKVKEGFGSVQFHDNVEEYWKIPHIATTYHFPDQHESYVEQNEHTASYVKVV